MKKLKLVMLISIIVLVCSLALGFLVWPNANVMGAFAKTGEPSVTFLGDPSILPQKIRNDLPTGYSWDSKGLDSINFNIKTFDENDSVALFSINPPFTDIKEQMDFAISLGKKEVFFFYVEPPDENDFYIPMPIPTKEQVINTIQGFATSPLEFLGIYPMEAYAHSVADIHTCGSLTVPPGACRVDTLPDDDSGDGLVAKTTDCIQFYACLNTFWLPASDHQFVNIADYDAGTPESFANCMRNHNSGSSFMRNPANYTTLLFAQSSDLVASPCNGNFCGCGQVGSKESPRISRSKTTWVAWKAGSLACDMNNWGVTRHELAHTYGYIHTEMDNNLDNVAHCINGAAGAAHDHRVF